MIYPDIDLEIWCRKHGILTDPESCTKCSEQIKMTKPIAIKDYRGVQAQPCDRCGHDSQIARFVPVTIEKLELWELLSPALPQQ